MHFLLWTGLTLLLIAASGCTDGSPHSVPAAQPSVSGTSGTVEKVEVYHFHGNQQCASCIAVGELAEKTVNADFRDELASGRLVFAHVNYDHPGNVSLAEKYGVTGSSLWIGVYNSSGFYKAQDLDVWYLIDNESAYAAHLTKIITERLDRSRT